MNDSTSDSAAAPAERVTLDDLKHRAEAVKDLAVTEAKGKVDEVLAADATRKVLVVAGALLLVVSVAYLMGTRAGARRVPLGPE